MRVGILLYETSFQQLLSAARHDYESEYDHPLDDEVEKKWLSEHTLDCITSIDEERQCYQTIRETLRRLNVVEESISDIEFIGRSGRVVLHLEI